MARTRWSAQALADLSDLIGYLRTRNPEAARRAVADLRALGRLIGRRPATGRPGEREGTREFSVPRWNKVVIYRVEDDLVEISTLRDTRMNHP